MIKIHNLTKKFGKLIAVNNINLEWLFKSVPYVYNIKEIKND